MQSKYPFSDRKKKELIMKMSLHKFCIKLWVLVGVIACWEKKVMLTLLMEQTQSHEDRNVCLQLPPHSYV